MRPPTPQSVLFDDPSSCLPADWLAHGLGLRASVHVSWLPLVASFGASTSGQALGAFLRARQSAGAVIYPPQPLRALELTALESVRVVIVGQDPYHGAGQGEGLAFSVAPGVPVPPSLRNILAELRANAALQPALGARLQAAPASEGKWGGEGEGDGATLPLFPLPSNPARNASLLAWAERGVLLLNSVLTVEEGLPASHKAQGWEALTDAVIQACAQKTAATVFMLWGAQAQLKAHLIALHNADGRHAVLMANHPSPLAARRPPVPFVGCRHFLVAQQHLDAAAQSALLRE